MDDLIDGVDTGNIDNPVNLNPVNQTDTSKESGNCLSATVATMFDLKLEQVPNFTLFSDEQWWDVFICFIWSLGHEVVDTRYDYDFEELRDGYLLASIETNYENRSHAVIIDINGTIIHDPLPNNPNNLHSVEGRLNHWYLIRPRKANN
jgi:hypothetical protein